MSEQARCDMHIHSALSVDGQYPPAEILEMVIEAGLKGAVITDHNEIDFSNEFSRIAKDKLLTLNGVELSTRGPGHENIHLLLYGIDSTKRLNKDLNYIRTQYEELTRLRIKKLNEMGIFVTWEDVENTTKKVPSMGPTLGEAVLNEKKNLSNPLLREIYEEGDPEDMGYRFYLKFLKDKKSSVYIDFHEYAVEDALKLSDEIRSISVIAHPSYSLRHKTEEEKIIFLTYLMDLGMQGIEVYSTHHSNENIKFLLNFARKNSLLITGGSDFHGPRTKPGIKMGDSSIPLKMMEEVIKRGTT